MWQWRPQGMAWPPCYKYIFLNSHWPRPYRDELHMRNMHNMLPMNNMLIVCMLLIDTLHWVLIILSIHIFHNSSHESK